MGTSLTGRTLGDFFVRDRIGAGGAGEVYLAEQVSLGRDAVIKVAQNAGGRERFLREARLASRLEHPFTAHVYGFGSETDGLDWIAMELVRGQSLDAFIGKHGPFALDKLVPLFERICEAVSEAHRQGIVHRDLKPQNIMLLERGGTLFPKLLDFGLARRAGDLIAKPKEATDETLEAFDEDDLLADAEHSRSQTLAEKLAATETLSLTREGTFVGTPEYMAPEQWKQGSTIDFGADIYALSLIVYYCLVGRHPYADETTMWTLASAHAKKPLPQLPAHLPSGINAVLAKGAAKISADRYGSVVDLSRALREAALLEDTAVVLPSFDPTLRSQILSRAPQPIAEAMAFVEAARTESSLLTALQTLRLTTERYIALVAFASWLHHGPETNAESELGKTLASLLKEGLDRKGWIALAQASVAPFAERSSSHPIPELVEAFFRADGSAGPMVRALQTMGATVQQELDALTKVFAVLGFVFDYPLVVGDDGASAWMGTRRPARLRLDAVLSAGPWIVTPAQAPAASLLPVMEVFSPGGGMPSELFFLEGNERSGARMIAYPLTFERQRAEVWEPIFARLPWLKQSEHPQDKSDSPPYKGLSTFSANDADNYFGREEESDAFANRLRLSPLLAVVGPSGTGKSSFVLAGVLPRLGADYHALTMRPGREPLATLAAVLANAKDATAPKLLVVDQFEELLTLGSDAKTQQTFARELVALADSGRAKVVLTLRDDFLIRALQLDALRDRLSSCLQLLGTPEPANLRRVITEPARRVGFAFDDESLPDRMVEAVAQYPGALALLSFASAQLWEMRDRQLKIMRARAYEAMGGVGGALAHHAEETRSKMSEPEQALLREAFRHLVTAQGTRAVLSRKELGETMGGSVAANAVIDALVTARLCVTSENPDGSDRVEIIHEALIVSWPRLGTWLREDSENARLRDAIRASARQWNERGQPRGLLWRDEALGEYKLWSARAGGGLTETERAFAAASLRLESLVRRTRIALGAAAFVSLIVALVLIASGYREARAQVLALKQEQGRLALLDGRPLEAAAYLGAALDGGADNDALDEMIGTVEWQLQGQLGGIKLDAAQAQSLYDPASKMLVACSLQGGKQLGFGQIEDPAMKSVTFSTGCLAVDWWVPGKSALLYCGTIFKRWTIGDNEATTIEPKGLSLLDAAQGVGGQYFLAAQSSGLWLEDPSSSSRKLVVPLPKIEFFNLRSSPGGKVALIGRYSQHPNALSGAIVYDGKAQTIEGINFVVAAVFSRDERLVALGGDQGEVGVYDLKERIWKMLNKGAHRTPISAVAFAPDGSLASASSDEVKVWDENGKPTWGVRHGVLHRRALSFSDKTQWLVIGTERGEVIVADTKAGVIRWRHHGHIGAVRSVYSEGQVLVSTAEDGYVYHWNLSQSVMEALGTQTIDVAVDRGGQHVALLAVDHIYSQSGGAMHPIAAHDGSNGLIARNARLIAVAKRGQVAIYDNDTIKRTIEIEGDPQTLNLADNHEALVVGVWGQEGAINLMRFVDGVKTTLVTPPKTSVRFALQLDPSHTIACGTAGNIWLWGKEDTTPSHSVAFLNNEECALSYDGQQIVTSDSSGKTGLLAIDSHGKLLVVKELVGDKGTAAYIRGNYEYITSSPAAWSRYLPTGLAIGRIPLFSKSILFSASANRVNIIVDQGQTAWRFVSPLGTTNASRATLAKRSRFVVSQDRLISE